MDPYLASKNPFWSEMGIDKAEPSMATNIINWVLVTPCSIPLSPKSLGLKVRVLVESLAHSCYIFLLRTEYSERKFPS